MPWADMHIEQLKHGEVTQCRPHGNSMVPIIRSGQLVTIDSKLEPEVRKAVLCRCKGSQYVHPIKAVRGQGDGRWFLIGNNRGGMNGWRSHTAIFGVVTEVMD